MTVVAFRWGILCFAITGMLCCRSMAQEHPVMDERFLTNERHWFEGQTNAVSASLRNGVYRVSRIPEGGEQVFTVDHYIDPSKDFTFELTLEITQSGEGAYAGLVWNYADMNNFDAFVVSDDGRFKVIALRYGTLFLVSDENSSSTHFRKKKANTLTVHRQGERLLFSVNEEEVFATEFPGLSFTAHGVYLMKRISCDFTRLRLLQEQRIVQEESFQGKKENLGTSINSSLNDSAPVVSPDGSSLFFVREKQGAHNADIFVSQRLPDGTWSPAQSIGSPLNNKVFNSVISCAPDNRSLLLLNTYALDGSYKGCCFSMSRFNGSSWSVPTDVRIENLNSYGQWLDASLSADGRTLMLSILRPGTLGYNDLYVSFLTDRGTWSEPQSLGPSVNTVYNDAGPFLAPDNRTLYFSSLGYPGYGNQDIFLSRRLDDSWTRWSKPVNLGPAVNGKGFDAFFSMAANDSVAFLVSNTAANGMDLFTMTLPQALRPHAVCLLKGKVVDSKTGVPLEAQLVYKGMQHPDEEGQIWSDKSNGSFRLILPVGDVYYLSAEKKGYYAQADSVSLGKNDLVVSREWIIRMDPLIKGAELPIRHLYFEQSRAEFLSSSVPALENLYHLMQRNPSLRIRIEGHTDNIGDAALNQQLSEQRALAVMEYLLKKGVEQSRMQHVGYGGTRPVADNAREETRRLNRRVALTVLEP